MVDRRTLAAPDIGARARYVLVVVVASAVTVAMLSPFGTDLRTWTLD